MTPVRELYQKPWAYCAYGVLCWLLLSVATLRADEYDTVRQKWFDTMVGAGYDPLDPIIAPKLTSIANGANSNWSSMDKSPTRTYLWSDLASSTVSANITSSYGRLRSMALAYATPGCSLQGNATLLADLLSALDWMHANYYNSTKVIYDNWWDFEIGTPMHLTDIAVLLYDQLSSTQLSNYMGAVEKFTPSATTQATGGSTGTFTGANRMWKIRVVAVRGTVVKDGAKLIAARDAFSALFPYVTSGDGFYTDGSFLQHATHPYTAGYGASLLGTIAPVMNLLAGSTWEVTDPLKENVYRWVFDSFEPIIYRGAAWDLVRGREAGRSGANAQATGHSMIDSIMQVAQFAPAADAARMKSMIKEWALSDTVRDFVSNRPLPTIKMAQTLMNDGDIVRRGELITHFTFPEMDRVVHLGAGYGFGLSMSSTRIANFESINGENLKGWYTGDGMTILYNSDLLQYGDNYWATIDAYRLPGVTVDVTKSKLPHQTASIGPRAQGQNTLSPHNWVGGATLDKFGAAGMQFKGVAVTLTGKKSWFMFDDEIVCLGAGITSTDGRPIETTVENRKISSTGANAFTVNDTKLPSSLGWTDTLGGTAWAHLAGHVGGDDIGYYFPQATEIRAVREARTGAISDIDDGGSTTPITRNYLRMTLDHGSNPLDATYQYVLLPGRSARHTKTYAQYPQVIVLTNTGNMQAVQETTLGITAANFWTDTTRTVGGITANKKCSVLVREDGAFIDVAVSDPTQANTGTIKLQIAKVGTCISADPSISLDPLSHTIDMTINVNGSNGKTFKARFYRGEPQLVTIPAEADTYTYDNDANKDSNYGNASNLVIKKSGAGFNREAYVRFNIPDVGGIMFSLSMGLYCLQASSPGVHGVYLVPDTSWSETAVTWNNAPAATGPALATWTPVSAATLVFGFGKTITNTGPISFKISATTQTADGYVSYASSENSLTSNGPHLTLAVGHTPPEVKITSPTDGAYHPQAGPVTITANAIATDGAVTEVRFYNGATLLGTDNNGVPYELATSLPGGQHQLTAVAMDANGLSRTSLVHHVEVSYAPNAISTTVTTPQSTVVDVDLRTLVSDVETPTAQLRFAVSAPQNGTVTLLADGYTARFTPTAGYNGPANFTYMVKDKSHGENALFLYDFQTGNATDTTGQGREATVTVVGTGSAAYTSDVPTIFAPQAGQSIYLTENGTAGAARLERALTTTEVDLKNGDWTIGGWFKRASTANIDFIVQVGESGGYGNSAMTLGYYGTGNTLELRNYNNATQDVGITKANVAANVWHHFAIVRNSGTLSLYVDGTLAGSDNAFAFSFDNSKTVRFGGVSTSTSSAMWDRWWKGPLADLAMFNTAFSASEVTKLAGLPTAYFAGQSGTNTVNVTVFSPLESWRIENFGSASNNDAGDADGDGFTNAQEYVLGTNPQTGDAERMSPALAGGMVNFSFTAVKAEGVAYAGLTRRYTVEYATEFGNPTVWTAVTGYVDIVGNNQAVAVSLPASGERRFYRVKVVLGL
ncbi:MAG TPA: polysaccharide lyase family 8 super-sandwich domain-containing protein [Verrucomicrobiae bacterium]